MIRLLLFLALAITGFSQSHAEFRAALIAHEGYSLTPYTDSLGYATIGIGHRIHPGNMLARWTPAQVEATFKDDLFLARRAAMQEVSSYHKHPPAVRIVLVGLAFQCGQTGLRQFKRFIAAINRHDYLVAAQELKQSKLARQTPKRVAAHVKVLTRAAK